MINRLAIAATAMCAFLAVGVASAQITYSPGEAGLVRGYGLTVDKLKNYIAANNAIKRDTLTNPALQRESEASEKAISVTALMARAKASPATMAYYRKEGLSEADAVLLPLAVVDAMFSAAEASLGKEYPTTPEQIAFVEAHPAEIAAFQKSGAQ